VGEGAQAAGSGKVSGFEFRAFVVSADEASDSTRAGKIQQKYLGGPRPRAGVS
jgi:hypothetical protein